MTSSLTKECYVVVAVKGDSVQFWQKWTSDSIKGRPKWVEEFNVNCLWSRRADAERVNRGSHFSVPEGSEIDVLPVKVSIDL